MKIDLKGLKLKLALLLPLLGAALSPAAARAEHVEAQTPFHSGLPLDSLVGGPASSSINSTQLVWGTSLAVHALDIGSAGQLTIRLTDIEWPAALDTLTLLVTDMDNMWEKLPGEGLLTLDLTGPAQLFVAVFARSDSWKMPGLYHLSTEFAPVPLPAAAWLLLSGLAGLGLLRRKSDKA